MNLAQFDSAGTFVLGVAGLARPERSSKLPRDPNQLAAHIVALSTGQEPLVKIIDPLAPAEEKNPAAVTLGRLGGMKGGKARAEKLTASERTNIARKAAEKAMGNKKPLQ